MARNQARLLLLEFFPSVLRRNESAMLFPFLKGYAEAAGARGLWLCFGERQEPDASEASRRLFALHLDAFRPTHVIASQTLAPALKAELGRLSPAPAFTVMPSPTMPDSGDPAVVSGRTGERRLFSRCAWLRLWLGAGEPKDDERFLCDAAQPDYGALLADQQAWTARPQITLAGGILCGNGRDARAEPSLKAALPEDRRFPGCTFCGSGRAPLSSPAADPIALAAKQLAAILATAGATGRNKSVYELYDIRAFWRFDELAASVLRLKLPSAVFLFNPRVDDVLRAAPKIERALPGLSAAGHEVRIMSMGVENFSPAENARFNKGITEGQVAELLALAAGWEKKWPGAFKPFKAGHERVELGFILFTPWTTPADLRANLDAAGKLGFTEEGYWLFSTLQLREGQPIWYLALKDGVAAGEFPDRGQAYGYATNGGRIENLAPWRFQDARVADYFNLLVRVCAAKREGGECAFFKDDPAFAEVFAALGGRAQELSPLRLALALLELVEKEPALPRAERLRRALELARPARQATPAAKAIENVFARLAEAKPAALAGLSLRSVGPREGKDPGTALTISLDGHDVELELFEAASKGPCFLRSKRFRAVCARRTPVRSAKDQKRLALLLGLLDAA